MSAAAPNPPPPAPPEPSREGITREEFDALQARLTEFQEAAERITTARSTEEEQRREREAREAAERVERTAERIGLSPADVGEIRGWIREETKGAVREALDELAVVRAEGEGEGQPPATSLAELQDDPTRTPPAAPAPAPPGEPPPPGPPPEEPPQRDHWFHRSLGGKPSAEDGAAG